MERLIKTEDKKEIEEEFSFKKFFIPLTRIKALHWIVILGFVVYFASFFNGFVWDDSAVLTLPTFQSLNIFYLFGPNEINNLGYYRPLVALYFAILSHLFWGIPFFYHFFQVCLHIINSCLLFLVFCLFLPELFSFILASFFLIHPINVESVAFVTSTQNELFAFFGLLAFLLNKKKEKSLLRICIIFLLLLASLFTKETGGLFLLMLIFYTYLYEKKYLKKYFSFGTITLLIYIFVRLYVGHIFFEKYNEIAIAQQPLLIRLLNVPAVMFYYLQTVIFPYDLRIWQTWIVTAPGVNNFYLPLLSDLAFIVIVWIIGKRLLIQNKKVFISYLFFAIWFFIGLAMHLQIIPLDMTVADRWFYVPFIGLLGMIGTGIMLLNNQSIQVKKILIWCGIILFLFYSLRTEIRIFDWKDELTLFTHDINVQSGYAMYADIGTDYENRGQYAQALLYDKKSLAIFTTDANLEDIASIYEKQGNIPLALHYYVAAAEKNHYEVKGGPRHSEFVDVEIARACLRYGSTQYARNFIEDSLRDYPSSNMLLAEYAIALYKLGNKNEAKVQALKAFTISPNTSTQELYQLITNNSSIKDIQALLPD